MWYIVSAFLRKLCHLQLDWRSSTNVLMTICAKRQIPSQAGNDNHDEKKILSSLFMIHDSLFTPRKPHILWSCLVIFAMMLSSPALVEATEQCEYQAPESCYSVQTSRRQSSAGNPHCSQQGGSDIIDISAHPDRDYMCAKLGLAVGCTQIRVSDLQTKLRNDFLYKNNRYVSIWPSQQVTPSHFTSFYKNNQHYNSPLPLGNWRTSVPAIDCSQPTGLLSDNLYGHCTRYALQLYLNEDCLNPDGKEIVIGAPDDGGTYTPRPIRSNHYPPVLQGYKNYGYSPDGTIQMCNSSTPNDFIDVAIFFNENQESTDRGATQDVCGTIFGTPNCRLDWLMQEVAGEMGEDIATYQSSIVAFEDDLTHLLTLSCQPDKFMVIGWDPSDDNETVVFERPEAQAKIPDGSLTMCDESSGLVKNVNFWFRDPAQAQQNNPFAYFENSTQAPGATLEICEQFDLDAQTCTRESLMSQLSDIMKYKDDTSTYENTAAAKIARQELLTKYRSDYQLFKKDLSHYLTINCRLQTNGGYADPVKLPKDGLTQRQIIHCPDKKEQPLIFFTNKNDTLISKEICERLNAIANNPKFAGIKGLKTVPPLPNGSCRVADIEEAIPEVFWGDMQAQAEAIQNKNTSWNWQYENLLIASAFAQNAEEPGEKPDPPTGKYNDKLHQALTNELRISCPPCHTRPKDPSAGINLPSVACRDGLPEKDCCHFTQPYQNCLGMLQQTGRTCEEDCIPGYEKNTKGECVPNEFWTWNEDQLRPKYLVGANWDDREYTGDARDFTYWFQRFGGKLTGFVAIIAVLFMTQQGVAIVLSAGSDDTISKAKKAIQWTFIGLAVVVFAYVIVKTLISLTYK